MSFCAKPPALPVSHSSTAAIGVGVGYSDKFTSVDFLLNRVVRWDASGAVTDLDTTGFANITYLSFMSVNDSGTVVGNATKSGPEGRRAVRWDSSGAVTELGNLGTDSSGFADVLSLGLNNAGTAVGISSKYAGGHNLGYRAVRWDASGTVATELQNLGTDSSGYTYAEADAINQAGTAAGIAQDYGTDGIQHAVRWQASGTAITQLGSIAIDSGGLNVDFVTAINNAGTIAGYVQKFLAGGSINKGYRPVRWDASGTAATALGNLGADNSGFSDSQTEGINEAGTIVGYAHKYIAGSDKGQRAVRWDSSGTAATELGILGTDSAGNTTSIAYAISDGGIAVGTANEYDDLGNLLGQRAVMWGSDGVPIKLDTLIDPASGWSNLYFAADISHDGWITGIGTFDPGGPDDPGAYDRLFLLQVPEPPSLVLAALASIAACCFALRRTPSWGLAYLV